MNSNEELENFCYEVNTVKELLSSPFYEKALLFCSDTQLNLFHIQCMNGNLDIVKHLLNKTLFKNIENYGAKAYKKSNALFLIANEKLTPKKIDCFHYLIENTELGKSLINERNNNDYNILMKLIKFNKKEHNNLIFYLLKNTKCATRLLEAKTDEGLNILDFATENVEIFKFLFNYILLNNQINISNLLAEMKTPIKNCTEEIKEIILSFKEKLIFEKNLKPENLTPNKIKL